MSTGRRGCDARPPVSILLVGVQNGATVVGLGRSRDGSAIGTKWHILSNVPHARHSPCRGPWQGEKHAFAVHTLGLP